MFQQIRMHRSLLKEESKLYQSLLIMSYFMTDKLLDEKIDQETKAGRFWTSRTKGDILNIFHNVLPQRFPQLSLIDEGTVFFHGVIFNQNRIGDKVGDDWYCDCWVFVAQVNGEYYNWDELQTVWKYRILL